MTQQVTDKVLQAGMRNETHFQPSTLRYTISVFAQRCSRKRGHRDRVGVIQLSVEPGFEEACCVGHCRTLTSCLSHFLPGVRRASTQLMQLFILGLNLLPSYSS